MRYFLNLSIKWKLALGFGAVIFSLLLVAGAALFTMRALNETQTGIQEIELNNVIDYMALDANLSRNRVLLYRMLRSRDSGATEKARREIAATSVENNAIMERLAVRVQTDPVPPEKFAALKAARDEFIRGRDKVLIPAIAAGRRAEAEAAFEAGTAPYREVSALAAELALLARQDARLAVEGSISLVRRASLVLYGFTLAAILFSAWAIILLHRAIALPVTAAAGAAARIAEGELEVPAAGADRQDEIGALEKAFALMTDSLRALAAVADHIADGDLSDQVQPRSKRDRLAISFNIMSENLQGIVAEMKAGAAEIDRALPELLELTRGFLAEAAGQDKPRRLQAALLRLEEVGKRFNLLAGRLRLPEGK